MPYFKLPNPSKTFPPASTKARLLTYLKALATSFQNATTPSDILSIKGPFAVQEYLVNEIQEVYRLQGVKINDKHVEDAGDSEKFKPVMIVTLREIREENSLLKRADKGLVTFRDAAAATSHPLLLGITKASLSTRSWVSAASFQETTKVLSQAAITTQ